MTRTFCRRALKSVLLAAGVVCLLAIPSSTAAQQIAGTVTDTTDAVLPGVTVEARSPALIEQVRTVTTNAQGQYVIAGLQAGVYSVTFTLPGFSTVVREGVKISQGFTADINAQLAVGSVSETVTVTGASPVVDVRNVNQQQVLTQEAIAAIPSGKSITGYGLLVPGMVGGEHWGTPLGQDQGGISAHGHTQKRQELRLTIGLTSQSQRVHWPLFGVRLPEALAPDAAFSGS